MSEMKKSKVKLNLADSYELVVGDTFELFWKGVLLANNPYNYNIKVSCVIGNTYQRKYVVTPTVSDIGTHEMSIQVWNDEQELLDERHIRLIVKDKVVSPASPINVLCVGDSTLLNGLWAFESCRRLIGRGGSPSGDGLGNIHFIGTCEREDVRYEAYGGWTFSSYNTMFKNNKFQWITCRHDKTVEDQHSIYVDDNGYEWKLETLEDERLKMICDLSDVPLLSNGKLTWVRGGVNHSDIVFTDASFASGNPFWNEYTGRVDFKSYVRNQGVDTLHYLYVLLGYNSMQSTLENYRAQVENFIANVHADFPDCKIMLMSLYAVSMDGCGRNEGCAWNCYEILKKSFAFNDLYKEIADTTPNVYYLDSGAQFDTEYGFPATYEPVNVRCSDMEKIQVNACHPTDEGYCQIADAVYRSLVHRLQEDIQ